MAKQKSYQKKTILQVVPALVSGGVERGTIEIAKMLSEHGHNSIVISSGGPLVSKLTNSGSKHIQFDVASKNPFKIWRNAKKIATIVRKHNVDIIHARSRAPAWSCGLAAKATGARFITTFHGIYNFGNFIKKYYNSIMTGGDKVIAVSDFVKQHIVDNYDIEQERIKVIHRGVNHEEFVNTKLDPKTLELFKKKYKVPDKTPVILLPSRFTNWKGQMYLLKALEKIRDENFYCLMVGDLARHPQYVERLKEMIHKKKMQAKVQLFGNEPNILHLYGMADIVVSASIEPEAFGRTIIEAQSMEKLVIATGIGGAAETVEHEKSGFHVKPGSLSGMAKQIKHCLSIIGTKEADQITKAARASVAKEFSLKKMLDSVREVYDE